MLINLLSIFQPQPLLSQDGVARPLLTRFAITLLLMLPARVSAFRRAPLILSFIVLVARAAFDVLPLLLTSPTVLVLPLGVLVPKFGLLPELQRRAPPTVSARAPVFRAQYAVFQLLIHVPFRYPKALPVHLLVVVACPIQLFG